MRDRRGRGRAAVVAVAFSAVVVLGLPTPGFAASIDDPVPPVTVNEFIPEDRDLSDCLSALPKPGCGSEARGGWRQTAIFGALIVGLGVIGTRIFVGIRRRDAELARSGPDS